MDYLLVGLIGFGIGKAVGIIACVLASAADNEDRIDKLK